MVEDHLARLRLTSPASTLFSRPATQDQTNVHLAYQQLLLSQSSKNRFQSITNIMIALLLALLPFAAYVFSGMRTESLGPFRYLFRDGISYLWTPRPAQREMYIYTLENGYDDKEDRPHRLPATLKQIETAVSSLHIFNLLPIPYPSAIQENSTQQTQVQIQMQPSPWEVSGRLWDGPSNRDANRGSGLQSCTEAQLELLSEALRRRNGRTRATNKDAFIEQQNRQKFVYPSGQWIVDEVLEATSSKFVFVLRES